VDEYILDIQVLTNVQNVQRFKAFKEVQMFKTQKFNVSQKPNFYRELCCEVSGDAAREGAN
jgi:hypothetical protein